MPQARKKKARSRTSSGHQGSTPNLLVFSIDHPLDYHQRLGKIVVAIAAKEQARANGEGTPFLAGLDKLSSLRPRNHAGEAGESEAS
jgi:hypothetical protein